MSVETMRDVGPDTSQVVITCVSADGSFLVTSVSESPTPGGPGFWQTRRVAAWCPPETLAVRLSLGYWGAGSVDFRIVTLDFLPI
jgi:hypothetical protein